MLPRLPRCAAYSRNLPRLLCDDNFMSSVSGVGTARAACPALCVDLDGTLIRGNVLWECVLLLLKTRPFMVLRLPYWLLLGRAAFKRRLSAEVHIDPAHLPYRREVLDLLQQEKSAGRSVALVTAADREVAEAI